MHKYAELISYDYIDEPSALKGLCDKYRDSKVIAIDTEFVRTQTLLPALGLIQVFDGETLALIDPIAIIDLSPFSDILCDENIIKIAHSCSEDLETLWHHLNIIPKPIYDTQFAANLLGLGQSVGYANLVESLFEISLDKGESRTDWLQRPLTSAQCSYASADVTHLLAIYEQLSIQTDLLSRSDWVYDEISQLAKKKCAVFPSDLAYLNLKNNWKLNGKHLLALQRLAKWRLETARELDKSINFVLQEQALFEIASKLPSSQSELFALKNLYHRQAKTHKAVLMNICKQVNAAEPQEYPKPIQRLIYFEGYKNAISLLKSTLTQIADNAELALGVLASKKQMNQLLKWCWFEFDELEAQGLYPDLLIGWRAKLIACKLPALEKSFSIHHEIKRSLQINKES